jgi:hypothetical protein
MTALNRPSPAHRFRVGDPVRVAAGFGYGRLPHGDFRIVALLPSNGVHFQYKIRAAAEAFDRTVQENQLLAVAAAH